MRKVGILGIGCTKFGELWDKSFRDGFLHAGIDALNDGEVHGDEIDAIFVGNMSAGLFVEQEHVGALVSDWAGLADRHIPSIRVEAACASGGAAFAQGVISVASGAYDVVVVAGVEKMTDVDQDLVGDVLTSAIDREWESAVGATLPSLYAMMARLHMHKYGTTREQLAEVAVKNHANAVHNPIAQYRRKIKVEDVLESPLVADPLRILDCSPITDGAAAVVLAPLDEVRKRKDVAISVEASVQKTSTLALHDRNDITTIDSTVLAAREAYKIAGISPEDVDVAEVHDCFTISEILAIEDLGFCRKGEGGKLVEEGVTQRDGKIPVNPSGGLKGCGHPVGATGVRQIVELVQQLSGDADGRQVDGAEIGLAQNVGGTGGTCVVHILRRVK